MSIHGAKCKTHQGGSSHWFEGLKKDRSLHLQLVQVSIRFMNNKLDPDSRLIDPFSIDKLVRELYSFKHFESHDKALNRTTATAYQATNRECLFRIGSLPNCSQARGSHYDIRSLKGLKRNH
jgi:hypothetical protein